jgi:hypothetical protein
MNAKSMHLELLVKIEAKCHDWEKFWVPSNAHIASMIEIEKRNYQAQGRKRRGGLRLA